MNASGEAFGTTCQALCLHCLHVVYNELRIEDSTPLLKRFGSQVPLGTTHGSFHSPVPPTGLDENGRRLCRRPFSSVLASVTLHSSQAAGCQPVLKQPLTDLPMGRHPLQRLRA